jgi:tetratricopeptide (TPR) repeat protein
MREALIKNRQTSQLGLLVHDLIAEERYEDLIPVVLTWISRIRSWEDWGMLLECLERVPEVHRAHSPGLELAYAEALSLNGRHDQLLEFTTKMLHKHNGNTQAQFLLFRSGSLHSRNDFPGTLLALETAIPFLTGESRGRALARLGLTRFQTQRPWEASFLEAKEFLTGRGWGLACLNFGHCLQNSKRPQEARAIFLEALSLLRGDTFSLAWLRYNLGSSYAQDLEFLEAERHFFEGQRLSNSLKSLSMQPSILNGLGSVLRAQGEWPRAEFQFRQAFQIATDSFDRVSALIGLARTLLFANRATEAIETLELGLTGDDLNNPDVQVARALVLLKLHDPAGARRALESMASPVVGTNQWLESLCRAELARRDGRLEDAVKIMTGLPTNTLHAREEVGQWPELFALLASHGLPVPVPLEYPAGLTVSVRACGSAQVSVNGRAVTLAPAGRVMELLVFLLESDGTATLEAIDSAFFPDATDPVSRRRANKAVWKLVETLRHALGWASSVIALGGAYQLDPAVTWQYDVTSLRERGGTSKKFLEGIYSEWALEVGHSLQVGSNDLL